MVSVVEKNTVNVKRFEMDKQIEVIISDVRVLSMYAKFVIKRGKRV